MATQSSTITYSLYSCTFPNSRRDEEWKLDYHHLSADDIRMIARVYQFKKRSIEKLIAHNSKRFNLIRKKAYEIQKCFHTSAVEFISTIDSRQPIVQQR